MSSSSVTVPDAAISSAAPERTRFPGDEVVDALGCHHVRDRVHGVVQAVEDRQHGGVVAVTDDRETDLRDGRSIRCGGPERDGGGVLDGGVVAIAAR